MMPRKKMMRMPNRKKMSGQSFIEYLVVLMMGVIILVTGDDPPIKKLASAIHEYYTDYSYAISISSMPNCFNSASLGPVTVGVDKCIDLQSPQWPVDISFDN
jgi:hypothetical protein